MHVQNVSDEVVAAAVMQNEILMYQRSFTISRSTTTI